MRKNILSIVIASFLTANFVVVSANELQVSMSKLPATTLTATNDQKPTEDKSSVKKVFKSKLDQNDANYSKILNAVKKDKELTPDQKRDLEQRYKLLGEDNADKRVIKDKYDHAVKDIEETQMDLAALLGFSISDKNQKIDPSRAKALKEKIASMFQVTQPIKMNYLIAVEANPGEMVLMSDNGRFLIKGVMYDTYNNMKALKNIDDVRNYALKTNYNALELDPDTLSTARIGNGAKMVVVYVDASSTVTHDIIEQLMRYPEKDEYTFYLAVVPADSPLSKELAMKFYCAREDGNQNIGNLLYKGELGKLPDYNDIMCKQDNFKKTLTAAYFTGVDGLPFFVDFDGSISRGIPPEGLYQWLTSHRKMITGEQFSNTPAPLKNKLQKEIVKQGTKQIATLEQQVEASKEYQKQKIQNVNEDKSSPTDNKAVEDFKSTKNNLNSSGQNYELKNSHEEEEEEFYSDANTDEFSNFKYDLENYDDAVIPEKSSNQSEGQNTPSTDDKTVHKDKSTKKSKEYTYEEISHAPFDVKNSKGDLNGFDMSSEIDRYLRESAKTDELPAVIDGRDQSTNYDVSGDVKEIEKTLSKYNEMDAQELLRKKRGNNRYIYQEVENLQGQIKKVRNEYIERRQFVKDVYEREYREADAYYRSIFTMKINEESKKVRQQKVTDSINAKYQKYQKKIAKLNKEENIKIKDLVSNINYLKETLN